VRIVAGGIVADGIVTVRAGEKEVRLVAGRTVQQAVKIGGQAELYTYRQ
jgi:hypothetical protein